MRRIIITTIILLIRFQLLAQSEDSTFTSQFEQFRKGITREHLDFRQSNDSLFMLFLEESWKEIDGKPNVMPAIQKPLKQPVFLNNTDTSDTPSLMKPEQGTDSITGSILPVPVPENVASTRQIVFYGSVITLPPYNSTMPLLEGLTKQAFTKYFLEATTSANFRVLVNDIKARATGQGLNDWGYYSLLEQVAAFYYTDNNSINAFLWASLLMSGLNVKIGFNTRNSYLLVPADVKLYTVSYTLGNEEYYSIGRAVPSGGERIFIHEADYPGNRHEFVLSINSAPRFESNPSLVYINNDKSLKIILNGNLIDYYRNYPLCDLSVQLRTPLSPSVIKQFDDLLFHLLKEKDDDTRTGMLLRFVQKTIRYENDATQFGKEKYQFAEEVLMNGAGDCEDRTALLAALLRRYTKHNLLGLKYPTHVSLAVDLSVCELPAFMNYEGRPFYHCDPTYLGAGCGMAMPAVSKLTPEIIKISENEL